MSLEDRRRAMEPNHVRTVEVQSLDALLRIEEAALRTEETLTSILEGMRHLAKQLKTGKALDELAENDAEDVQTGGLTKPKGKRK